MPVKRRLEKRRRDPAAEAEAWESTFQSGWDFFSDLPELGVATDAYGRPDRDEAESAWRRLGHIYLANANERAGCWALETFGELNAD